MGSRQGAVPFAVAAYITAAYWFTASTSFANPAVTLARSATDTFAGIRPADVPGFLVGQAVIFTRLRLEALDQMAFQRQLDAIGQIGRETVVE